MINDILNKLTHKLCLVYRHFPISSPQAISWKAAEAAEAASAQGKFWEMHDLLYQNSPNLKDDKLVECAAKINLDIPHFLKGLSSHEYKDQIQADIEHGLGKFIDRTPTISIWIDYSKNQNIEALMYKILEISNMD